MISIKFTLRKDISNENGDYPIHLQLIQNRKSSRLNLKKYIPLKLWNGKGDINKKNWIRASPRSTQLNTYLFTLYMRVEQIITQNENISTKEIIELLKKGKEEDKKENTSFLLFVEQERERYPSVSSKKKCNILLTHLRNCFTNVQFEDLTHAWLIRFDTYLRGLHSDNTLVTHMKVLKALYNKARAQKLCEAGLFDEYKMKKPKVIRERLTSEELNILINAKNFDSLALEDARNTFLFAYYCQGIRAGDLVSLKFSNIVGEYLVYDMTKTGDHKKVKIHDKLKALIEHYKSKQDHTNYILPWRKKERRPNKHQDKKTVEFYQRATAKKKYNNALKLLGVHLNFDLNLTTHVARHTFADLARKKTGDIYAVSKALGHKNIATTQTYLNSFDQDSVDKLSDDLFD